MCTCMFVCMCAHVCAWVCVCMGVSTWVYMCMYVCLCVCDMHIGGHVCLWLHRIQKSQAFFSVTLHHIPLRQAVSLNLELSQCLECLGIPFLFTPHAGLAGTQPHPDLYVRSGYLNSVLMLMQTALRFAKPPLKPHSIYLKRSVTATICNSYFAICAYPSHHLSPHKGFGLPQRQGSCHLFPVCVITLSCFCTFLITVWKLDCRELL